MMHVVFDLRFSLEVLSATLAYAHACVLSWPVASMHSHPCAFARAQFHSMSEHASVRQELSNGRIIPAAVDVNVISHHMQACAASRAFHFPSVAIRLCLDSTLTL